MFREFPYVIDKPPPQYEVVSQFAQSPGCESQDEEKSEQPRQILWVASQLEAPSPFQIPKAFKVLKAFEVSEALEV